MNRWLHKLTKKEIWQLHHDVICEDSLKKCEISKLVNDVTDENIVHGWQSVLAFHILQIY